jgi:hypothetical protein
MVFLEPHNVESRWDNELAVPSSLIGTKLCRVLQREHFAGIPKELESRYWLRILHLLEMRS